MTEEQVRKAAGMQPQVPLETHTTAFIPTIPIQVNLIFVHNLIFVYTNTSL